MMYQTIIVSGYFAGDAQVKKVAYFDRLDRYIQQFNYKLLLLNYGGAHDFTTNCEYLCLPQSILGNATRPCWSAPFLHFFGKSIDSEELIRAAGIEAEATNTNLETCARQIGRFQKFIQQLFQKRQPQFCILWHQFHGFNWAMRGLCQTWKIPFVFAEYGSLPGTIVFEKEGQMAESWVSREHERFCKLPVNDEELATAEQYLNHVREEKRSRKPQSKDVSIEHVIQKSRQKKRKVIFYAGQNDPRTGMLPVWLPNARLHSPFFLNTLDALNYLSRLAEKHNWQIIFKPHPMREEAHRKIETTAPERVDYVIGANIFDCMIQADMTCTIVSQVSYLALIHERPLVLLGRNQLSGKGCVYEASDFYNIEETLQQSLYKGVTTEQKQLWLKHVAQLYKYYLFAFDESIEHFIGRGIDDAARYLLFGLYDEQHHISRLVRQSDSRSPQV